MEADSAVFGGRVVETPAGRELRARFTAMTDALYRIGPATPNQVRTEASRHLTADVMAGLVATAQREADEEGARMVEAVERGGWVWD